ncbi:SDR family NAD(P)-dependent oxidoreductase [Histomonas meleagridis]|uniref:SDR family NAD(P)-dependent oxidoreductase n=1 Tax=Histomonas meleagridis TaxID=135588 RepID=UPI003559EB7E|nr:SDR family NAD(P)-dependent oxidoreductase [Histomonas meleagridis]
MTRAVLPYMRAKHSGRIFTITSVSGVFSVAGGAIYASSKFAVEGLMEGLAQEVKPLGIRSTIIEPGFFKTDFLDGSSVKYSERNIPDYAPQFETFRKWHESMNHKQAGDPAKLGSLIVKLSEMEDPPVRLATGTDAYKCVIEKAENLRSEAERNKEMSFSTDGETDMKVNSLTEVGK